MKSITVLAALFITGLVSIVVFADESAESGKAADLWNRAVLIGMKNQDLIPGRIITVSQECDRDGHAIKHERIVSRQYCDETGSVHTEVIEHRVEGGNTGIRDYVRSGRTNGWNAEPSEPGEFSIENDLFDAFWQPRITLTPFDEVRIIDGKAARGYQFSIFRSEREKITGLAWIDADSGVPVFLEYAPVPLPGDVKEMKQTLRYYQDSSGNWFPGEMTTEGEGSYLLMKLHFKVQVNFTDFFRKTEAQTPVDYVVPSSM